MVAPHPTGDRLALVFGHSLPEAAFLDRGDRIELPGRDGAHPIVVIDTGDLLVLRRHGLDHFVPAHRIDHHRHIEVLCERGANRVLALGSTGSLRLDWPPGTVVAPDDVFAPSATPTYHAGVEGHSIPGFDSAWRARVIDAWTAAVETTIVDGGVYAQTTGPRFETPAEVRYLAAWADLVGMTLADEVVLAREAGLAYAAVCMVDNLANGLGPEQLTMEDFWATNAANERRMADDLDRVLPEITATDPDEENR
jgi:5'-methylthioadenosine phosphorylase